VRRRRACWRRSVRRVAEAARGAGAPQAVQIDGIEGAALAALDRGLHYGDGLFETIACPQGTPRLLARHLARLSAGCARLAIGCPPRELLAKEISALAQGAGHCVVKLILTRGPARSRGYRPAGDEQATRILLRYPWPAYDPALEHDGVPVRIATVRLGENPALAGLKHLNRLEQVLAAADLGDAAEALMYSSSGALIAGTMSNVFLIVGQTLHTPQLDACGVAGVMRSVVLQAAAAEGMRVEIRRLEAPDLAGAREVFLTNALIGIRPVRTLDERLLTVGEVTRHLQARLAALELAAGAPA
jgi:4-amino-4-deoxychorismate lyase